MLIMIMKLLIIIRIINKYKLRNNNNKHEIKENNNHNNK
jgi:hypothetical protein